MKYTNERKYRDFLVEEEKTSKSNGVVKKLFNNILKIFKK